jgi:hypothetical protein
MNATASMFVIGVGSALIFASSASAQAPAGKPGAAAYPTKPVRIVIPYPPGGTSDILARMLGVKLTEIWGQQVLVETARVRAAISAPRWWPVRRRMATLFS